jgi:hypothetical protein
MGPELIRVTNADPASARRRGGDGAARGSTRRRSEARLRNRAMPRLPLVQALDGIIASGGQSQDAMTRATTERSRQQAFFSLVQPKLAVGDLNDPLEREADRVADRVVRMPDPERPGERGDDGLKRSCADCVVAYRANDPVRRKALGRVEVRTAGGDVSATRSALAVTPRGGAAGALDPVIGSLEGGGEALPLSVRRYMEPRFARDFTRVRVHTNDSAADLARRVGARAFTLGRNVVFAAREYAPDDSADGRRLLAHELAHVVQQGQSRTRPVEVTIRQGVDGAVKVPEETAWSKHDRPGSVPPTLQRSAKWKGAVVHETINAARIPFDGPTPLTWQLLNGVKLGTELDAQNAIKVPRLEESAEVPPLFPESITHHTPRPPPVSTPAGRAEAERRASATSATFMVRIGSVPAQEGSADETVLRPGPWSTIVTREAVKTRVGIDSCGGAGMSRFSEHGQPSDGAVYRANRHHEDHHVADHKVAFEQTVGQWDKEVQAAKDKRAVFRGATRVEATIALWDAIGHTPGGAARAYRAIAFEKGGAYHNTPPGGPMKTSNEQANRDCSVSSVDVTNPAG